MTTTDLSALTATRQAFHRLAVLVISPVQERATTGRIALESRPGGFGTHDLPGGGWAGVSGVEIVVVAPDGSERRASITSLRAAAEFVDDDDARALPDGLLNVDVQSAGRLARVFSEGTDALVALRDTATPTDAPSGIDLWPEHFDVAITLGDEASGKRATYGVSPGDDAHSEPYAYVGPWVVPHGQSGWDAVGFDGATHRFVDAADTLAFWQERRAALQAA